MKVIELADHELSLNDYSNFELNLLLKAGLVHATVDQWTTSAGMKRIRVRDVIVQFDESKISEAALRALTRNYGFRTKSSH